MITAADIRDVAKDKLVSHSEQLMKSGKVEIADLVFSGAQEQARRSHDDRRIARRVRLREDEARKKQRVHV